MFRTRVRSTILRASSPISQEEQRGGCYNAVYGEIRRRREYDYMNTEMEGFEIWETTRLTEEDDEEMEALRN